MSAPDAGATRPARGGALQELPVEFRSEGALLRGILLTPAGAARRRPTAISGRAMDVRQAE